MAESMAARGGTKQMTVSISGWAALASATKLYTGTPWTSCPPLPGVTPATIWVPASIISLAWREPDLPVIPWTSTLLSL